MKAGTSKFQLIRKMLHGLAPLIIFIAADEIWGTQIGLIVAVAFGNLQLLWIWFLSRRLDRFILFDTLLIVVLGLVSVALENEIFFKLKPGLIGVILCVLLGISTFSSRNIVLSMSKRYMKGVAFGDEQARQFKRSVRILFYIFTFHTLLVFYSAFFLSKEAWAFISGGLFYILFGVFFVAEIIRAKVLKAKAAKFEWLPVLDAEGSVIGKATRQACHNGKKLLHPVVHVHILNKSRQLYLQKRPAFKQVQPGKWDTAVGGHVAFNETADAAVFRECNEELGIKEIMPKLLMTYRWDTDLESEMIYMYITVYNEPIVANSEEVETGRFWSFKEIGDNLGKNMFTPNFEKEFRILRDSFSNKRHGFILKTG
ncbi:MAG: NUDIX domain-containing protein [Bacteroidetes bacterium]|nr:NUDIX domain-containing protein [Bacteroidota bacterium]